ncbi:uncharacterized protein [Miscanthus floridulus]|uniref:uncharacterized protein n=1 Tax=Miscanthus floridulus TaxID=154761 RepID=UPI003459EE0B
MMRPSWGFLSLGMRDVRASPPPVPEDARRWAINLAHTEAQKKRKDAKAAKCMKKILAHEELDKHCQQQRKDGLPLEESPSPSLSTEASDGDDEGEMGHGPLDHLPDVGEAVLEASASYPAPPGGGGGADPGSAIARSRAEADTPEAKADPKEPATQGGAAEVALTQEGEGAPLPRDGEAHGSDAAEVPLAVETTGTEVPEVSQAGATEAAAPRTIEAAAAGTRAPATAEATMAEAGAPETTKAMMAEAGAPGTTEATMEEARAPRTTDADVIVAGMPAQEVEMKAAEALVAPLVQGPPPLREST